MLILGLTVLVTVTVTRQGHCTDGMLYVARAAVTELRL